MHPVTHTSAAPMSPSTLTLDLAELVLITSIRTNVTVRSRNADAMAILNVLGPRHAFPSITDTALHHMLWIDLGFICRAGDTQLLGRLLDPTLPKPTPPIRTLRHSPFALARASKQGHLDTLGYWLRLACRYEAVPLTVPLVARSIAAAARAGQRAVVAWWLQAIPKLFLTHDIEACWTAAFAAAESVTMLGFLTCLRSADSQAAAVEIDATAIVRAHTARNVAVVDWWFAHHPRLANVRFLARAAVAWSAPHFAANLNHLLMIDLARRAGPCMLFCWDEYTPSCRLMFADLDAWRRHAPDLLAHIVHETTCKACVDIMGKAAACPVAECAIDHCSWCAMPADGRWVDWLGSEQNLVTIMCKHGHVEGFRAYLRARGRRERKVAPHALHVASKHGQVGILKVWLDEYEGTADDFRAYPVWDGVEIEILDWLLEHDEERKWLRWMGMDEASRAGNVEVLDWWVARFHEGRVPTLRYSYRAMQFKSYESGIKSLRFWLQYGLLDRCRLTVSVWRYCYYEQYQLVEILVAADVSVCFERFLRPLASVWRRRRDELVVEGIKEWRQVANMGAKTGRTSFTECTHAHPPASLAASRHAWMELVCKWSQVLEHNSAKEIAQ